MAVWVLLYSKHVFWEKKWVIALDSPPESKGRRRVDVTIKKLAGDNKFAVLAFHEAEALDVSPQDLQDAEHQAVEACMRYLGKEGNGELGFVYAVTSFGTKGRAWRYERGADYLTPVFGSDDLAARQDYVELHSTDAQLLRASFDVMRNAQPYH